MHLLSLVLSASTGLRRRRNGFRAARSQFSERTLEPGHVEIAFVLQTLANIGRLQKHHDRALLLYTRSLEIMERALGRKHPEVAALLTNQAGLNFADDRYDEAEVLLRRALAIHEHTLEPNDPTLASSRQNYAVIRGKLNRKTRVAASP